LLTTPSPPAEYRLAPLKKRSNPFQVVVDLTRKRELINVHNISTAHLTGARGALKAVTSDKVNRPLAERVAFGHCCQCNVKCNSHTDTDRCRHHDEDAVAWTGKYKTAQQSTEGIKFTAC
jgi:hypothetical protein